MSHRIACLTLDVEADHHDLVSGRYYEALDHEPTWEWLLQFSRQRGLPWTAFVVGELLETRPDLAQRLAATGWEIGLHAYSHDPMQPDTLQEIRCGKQAFHTAFGRPPTGYRAPLGLITSDGLRRLQAEGFRYDSSLFPAWRPGVFNHLDVPVEPFVAATIRSTKPESAESEIARQSQPLIEIPLTVIPRLRVIVSVSYLRLLGLTFYRPALALFGLPDVAVIDCHLHDLAPAPAAFRELPPFWKFVYRRNWGRGRALLTWLVDWLTRAGYEFRMVGDVAACFARRDLRSRPDLEGLRN